MNRSQICLKIGMVFSRTNKMGWGWEESIGSWCRSGLACSLLFFIFKEEKSVDIMFKQKIIRNLEGSVV